MDLATLFWCMVSTFWFILDGDGSSYFRPLPVLMRLNTEGALID